MTKNKIFILSIFMVLILGSACGKNQKTTDTIDDLNNRQPVSNPTNFDLGKSGHHFPPHQFANDFCGLIREAVILGYSKDHQF